MLPLSSLTQSGNDSLISIPIEKYRLMTTCPIMLDGCNERYELLQTQLRLENLQHRDTVQLLTNQLTIQSKKTTQWKRKARRRVLIFSGVGVLVGFIFGILI